MKVNAYASLPHYAAHIRPIFEALPDDLRGEAWGARFSDGWGERLPVDLPERRDPVLVAAFTDAVRMSHQYRPVIYVEHGAGQTYLDPVNGSGVSYSGGDHDGLNVILYVCPNVTVAARWQARYPGRATAVVGCPKLDGLHREPTYPQATIVWTWHWQAQACPESTPALPHYQNRIGACVAAWRAQGWNVAGHGHPRDETHLRAVWRTFGVPWWTVDDVLEHGGILVADNTSLAFEFASLDRPVVTLNAPWYRRKVEHGLRFWSHIPGIQIDDPGELEALRLADVVMDDDAARLRRAVVADVYAACDGNASARAAAAIVEAVGRI